VAELASTPADFGIEMDVRSSGERLVVTHDAFHHGDDLREWLAAYRHAFLVVNVKEEGLEHRVEELLGVRGIERWSYLDQSFPFLVKTLRRGETRCAVRVSEYESVQTALALPVSPDWVWLDSFTGAWPSSDDLRRLQEAGFRIMVVSPELQGRAPEPEVETVRALFARTLREADAVCTKRPALWG